MELMYIQSCLERNLDQKLLGGVADMIYIKICVRHLSELKLRIVFAKYIHMNLGLICLLF